MAKFSKKSGGFIQIIIIIVGALVLLKYIYDVDVVGFLTEGKPRAILDKAYGLASQGWEKYKDVIIGVWNYIIDLFKKIKS